MLISLFVGKRRDITNVSSTPRKQQYKFVEMVDFQLMPVCYKKLNKICIVLDINMKLIHNVFHMMNDDEGVQGCSLIYTGLPKPGLSVTLGIIYQTKALGS